MEGRRYSTQGVRLIGTATIVVAVFIFHFIFSPSREGEVRWGWNVAHAATPSVVINEVMWMGSSVSGSDEWIELRNMTDEAVDLTDWSFKNAASGLISLKGSIPPQGYFLLRRQFTSSYTASALRVEPAQMASLSLTNISNTRGNVELLHNNQIVDVVLSQPWPAGIDKGMSGVRQSMQRVDPPGDGLLIDSWHTCTTEECTSADFWKEVNGLTFGTPGSVNSVPAINTAPEPIITGATSGLIGQTLSWSAEDSSDADNNELAFSWSFGDGGSASGATASHTYTSAGSFTVTLTVADSATEVETTRSVTVTAPFYSNAIVINELLPNPAGSDTSSEFIELKNTSDDTVDLAGWQLDDADGGSAPYTIPASTILSGGSIKSFSRADTKLALNNTGDSVRLLDPSGAVKSSYTYSSSVPEGQSYNRTGEGSYSISTTLTPGAANTITAPVEEDEEEADSPSSSTSARQGKTAGKVAGIKAVFVALKDIREEEEGTTITTEGVVSVPPGVFGEREAYLAGSGIQLYFHKATWPEFKLGDRLTVTGELGSNRGEARLKISDAKSIVRGKSEAPPTPHVVETGEIGEDYEGWLVTVQGEVVETSGDTFYVDDGSGEIKIYIRSTTKIDKPKMKTGEAVTITGVVSETTSGYRILPRFQEDVRLGRVAGLTSFPETGRRSAYGGGYGLQAGLLASGGAAVLMLQSKKKREPLLWRANQNH